MTRRRIFTTAFIVFVGAIVWYASSMIRIPELTFDEAAKIGDHKARVMIPSKVIRASDIAPDGSTVTFFVVDRKGVESKVYYEGSDALTPSQLANAAKSGNEISIAGHVCGDQFKASAVYLPVY